MSRLAESLPFLNSERLPVDVGEWARANGEGRKVQGLLVTTPFKWISKNTASSPKC